MYYNVIASQGGVILNLSQTILILLFIFSGVISAEEKLKELEFNKRYFDEKQLGFTVIDLETGKVIRSHNSEVRFVPASISKIPTVVYALENLGADFQFKTSLRYDGNISSGVLRGNLFLEGGGDPYLTEADLMNLVLSLQALGVSKVSGGFIFNDDYLIPHSSITNIGPNHQTYNPGVSALSSQFNRLQIFREGKSRKTSKSDFQVLPSMPSVKVEKTSKKFKNGKRFGYEVSPIEQVWKISKFTNYRKIESIPTRNPSMTTAGRFRFLASQIGVELPEPKYGPLPTEGKLIHEHKSLKLIELSKKTLEFSNNLFAELLLLTAVREVKGQAYSIEDSAGFMRDWLIKSYGEESFKNFVLENGSGLSINSRHTPLGMSKLLSEVSQKRYGLGHFWSILSISGRTGWLRKRLREPETAYRVWGKTGSMDYVSNISGYLIGNSKKKYAFSIYMNDIDKRLKLDENNSVEDHQLRRKAPRWNKRSKKVQDEILTYWISSL